jgi:hypothetical protein
MESRYRKRAREQGVERPLKLLASMPHDVRHHLAGVLGVSLGRQDDPEAEAWALINRDLRGLQARSHGPREQLVPGWPNHNWWQILLSAARKLGLEIYPGLSEREVERMVFDEAAAQVIERLDALEVAELDRTASEDPFLSFPLRMAGVSRDGLRLVLAAVRRVARLRREAPEASLSSYLREGISRRERMPSLGRSLRFLRSRFHALVVAFTSMDALTGALGRARARPMAVFVTLYLHSLLEEGIDEAEALRT